MDYPGANSYAGGSPVRWCDVWALAEVPDRPLSSQDLTPYRTPHAPAPLAWLGSGTVFAALGLSDLLAVVRLRHPVLWPPLTVRGLALVSPDGGQHLVGLVPLLAPVVTSSENDLLTITLEMLAVASYTRQLAAGVG